MELLDHLTVWTGFPRAFRSLKVTVLNDTYLFIFVGQGHVFESFRDVWACGRRDLGEGPVLQRQIRFEVDLMFIELLWVFCYLWHWRYGRSSFA